MWARGQGTGYLTVPYVPSFEGNKRNQIFHILKAELLWITNSEYITRYHLYKYICEPDGLSFSKIMYLISVYT